MSEKLQGIVGIMKRARESGLAGDLGIGGVVGLLVGLPLYLWTPGDAIFGLPPSMVWGASAAVAVSLLSMSLGLIPDHG